MADQRQTCKDCRFWDSKTRWAESQHERKEPKGLCRRYAPGHGNFWLETDGEADWCGELQPIVPEPQTMREWNERRYRVYTGAVDFDHLRARQNIRHEGKIP